MSVSPAEKIALPVGPAVDPTPAPLPGDVTLEGRFGTVERLDAARHGAALWQAVRGHDEIWTYLPPGPFADDAAAFATWLKACEQSKERTFYAIVDQGGSAIGLSALMEIRPAMRVIEVGHIVYSPRLQRSAMATEAQYLAARHVFEELGYRRYEWKCNALNAPSMRAARRLGFKFEGIFRQHMIVKGRNRDTAWFAMTDGDWPAAKQAFERWLDIGNFDGEGRQRESLSALNGVGALR